MVVLVGTLFKEQFFHFLILVAVTVFLQVSNTVT